MLHRVIMVLVLLLAAFQAQTAVPQLQAQESQPIEYRIVFTQTYFHPNFGPRPFEGRVFVDSSIIGPGFENRTYGPSSALVALLTDFTITLNGSTVYLFDLAYTQAIVSPNISTVLATGPDGEVIDLQGAFTLPGTISSIILGGEGHEGEYVDFEQVDPFTSVVVSSGTYEIYKPDNCLLVANFDQRDTDDDGIGNMCDPDFDQNCIVNFIDLNIMKAFFFLPGDFHTDLNGDGLTNFADLNIMKSLFFLPPGPSGVLNICDP